jgi:SAM-dependent methyltransferase
MKPKLTLKPGKFYDSQYHSHVHSKMMESDDYFQGRAEVSRALYFKGLEDKKILDFGCGMGQSIALLPKAAGFDASREARENCRKRGIQVYGRLEQVPRKKWDIVFCSHVLEHLENPLGVLRKMRSLLSPGGRLLLVLPKEGQGPATIEPDINQHLYCWNFRSINNLLFRAGFRVLSNEYRYYNGFRAFLPLRKVLGTAAYISAVQGLGRLRGLAELLITAGDQSGRDRH